MELFDKLIKNNLSISFAESLTGGLLASSIIDNIGASKVIKESYVTYSNEAKIKILGVNSDTIIKNDVVSREVALEMVQGLKRITNADICVSTTGYASFDINNNKDTGLCYYAISYKNQEYIKEVKLNNLNRNKLRNKLKDIIFNDIANIIE